MKSDALTEEKMNNMMMGCLGAVMLVVILITCFICKWIYNSDHRNKIRKYNEQGAYTEYLLKEAATRGVIENQIQLYNAKHEIYELDSILTEIVE